MWLYALWRLLWTISVDTLGKCNLNSNELLKILMDFLGVSSNLFVSSNRSRSINTQWKCTQKSCYCINYYSINIHLIIFWRNVLWRFQNVVAIFCFSSRKTLFAKFCQLINRFDYFNFCLVLDTQMTSQRGKNQTLSHETKSNVSRMFLLRYESSFERVLLNR